MTAREEAIDAALFAYVHEYTGEETVEDAGREGYVVDDMRVCMEEAIDAIPADVLARYAIERGGLIGTAADPDGAYYDTATGDFVYNAGPLYRLAEGVGE